MQAICFLSANKNTKEQERRYFEIPEDINFKKFVITDKKDNLNYNNVNHYTYSFDKYITDQSVYRYTYISIVDFYKHNPNYDYYWLIEDDVCFNGNFLTFFNFYKDKNFDFIVGDFHYNDPNKKGWYNSPYQKITGNYISQFPIAGGLSFICRYSNKLLYKILELTTQKIYGHCESFPHTVCMHNNFSVHQLIDDSFFDIKYCCHDTRIDINNIEKLPKNILLHACKF